MTTLAVERCPGCSSDRATDMPFGRTALKRCASCDLVYSATYDDPDEIYVDGYLTENTEWGIDVMRSQFQAYLRYCAAIRLERIERLAPVGSLLDVGCGTGEVLAVARERGWDVTGVEPVEDSSRCAVEERGLPVINAFLEDSELPERSFDVVTAFHVLEHLRDGVAFLELIARWVRPGGLIVVEMPNWNSQHRRHHAEAWPHLRPNEHLAHYSVDTLTSTLERAGLESIEVTTLGFVWSGQSLAQQQADLGLRGFRRLGRIAGRPGSLVNGVLISAIQGLYSRLDSGMVVLGAARVQ